MNNDLDLTQQEAQVLYVLNYIFSSLSLVAECFMFFAIFKTWKHWTYSGKLIICLTISNTVYTISNFIPVFGNDIYFFCQVDGFLRTFAILTSSFWAARISLVAYRAIESRQFYPDKSVDLFKGFVFPFLVAIMYILFLPLIHYFIVLYFSLIFSNTITLD